VSNLPTSAVVIGASSGVGRALARALAARGTKLLIVSRDRRDIEAAAADIRERFGCQCLGQALDIASPDFDARAFADAAAAWLGEIDAVYIPAGSVREDDSGPNPDVLLPLTATNYLGPALLAAEFGRRMQEKKRGEIVLFSSIAAGAPRTRNAAYSASKAALEVYARGLRHSFEPHGVAVRVYALGYVDTPLSYGRPLLLPLASPEEVAEAVLRDQGRSGVYYLPFWWSAVVFALQHLPWPLYRRLKF